MSNGSSPSSSEKSSASAPYAPGRINLFPIRLTMKCVDKPGERRGVVILEAPSDGGRLVLKVGNPILYEGFFGGREYRLVVNNGVARTELVQGDGGA